LLSINRFAIGAGTGSRCVARARRLAGS